MERAQLLAIFNSIDQAIYVADPETYRILFVNTYLREHLGYDPTGALCYEAFQGRTAPCAFCTNAIILAQKAAYFPITKAIYELFQLLGDGRYLASALGTWAMAFLALTIVALGVLLGRKAGALFRG